MNSDRDTRCRVGCPIRRSRDQRSLASPPGFSQRAASVIASQCQGIHQMPFIRARSQEAPAPRDHSRITRKPRRPGKPPRTGTSPTLSRQRGNPARGRSHEDTSSDGARTPAHAPQDNSPIGQKPVPAARPPRSHSQIRFTLQSTPARNPGHRRGNIPARPPRHPEPNLVFSEHHLQRPDCADQPSRKFDLRSLISLILARVEVNGIEPMTSCLQSRRSPN